MAITNIMTVKSFSMSINGHETYIHDIIDTEVMDKYCNVH